MEKIEITGFQIKFDKDTVLKRLGCDKKSSIYSMVSEYFDETERDFNELVSPRAVINVKDMRGYCLLTVGGEISDYSRALFDKGEGMRGLLADTMADEYLFEMDRVLYDRIKLECAKKGWGVKKRLEAPQDIPLSEQKTIAENADISGVGVTEAFMFEPVKTFGYILEFTTDKDVFNAQHDCSKCSNFDCPRRSNISGGRFEILSDYKYTPELAAGDSAVCIDIGTTTAAFELVTDKGTVKTYRTVNPQRRFGLDVLSRIEASNRGRGSELASLIRYALMTGYKEVTRDYGDVKKVVIAGNTAMVHLLMNYSCRGLGCYPFKSEHLGTIKTTFDKLTESNVPPAETVIYGGISPFVGGDIVSGLYMCDFDKSDSVNMFIDLGTNGEMAIGNSTGILATSTAAGPAFEGGRISCGTGSVDGAVCGVDLKTGTIKTIGGKPPVGLCGTGIIELVAELLDAGIIDNTGLLSDDYFVNGYRLSEDIVFMQEDIRQVQMAKAAVKAGVETLTHEYGVRLKEVDRFYLAGGFAYGLSVEKACRMGLLPSEVIGKTEILGNSSLGGCVKYCAHSDADRRIEYIKSVSHDFSLAETDGFDSKYIQNMNFS